MAEMRMDGKGDFRSLIRGWEQSRATNPSMGDDPVSLGEIPGGAPYVERPATPNVLPQPEQALHSAVGVPAERLYQEMQQQAAAQGPMLAPPPEAPKRAINLDAGLALIDGEIVGLQGEELQIIMGAVTRALERQLRDRIQSLKYEYGMQPIAQAEPAVWPAGSVGAVVRQVQREAEATQPTEQGQASPTNMQSLPPPKRRRNRKVFAVPGAGPGVQAPEPGA